MCGGARSASGCGDTTPASSGAARSIRTRRSYHAAWPVTGSLLAWRKPSCAGSHSEMTWFSRKPCVASGLSVVRPQAPARLPMAFQVQTVSGFTPSISRSWHLSRPARLSTQTQSSSPSPISRALARAM